MLACLRSVWLSIHLCTAIYNRSIEVAVLVLTAAANLIFCCPRRGGQRAPPMQVPRACARGHPSRAAPERQFLFRERPELSRDIQNEDEFRVCVFVRSCVNVCICRCILCKRHHEYSDCICVCYCVHWDCRQIDSLVAGVGIVFLRSCR